MYKNTANQKWTVFAFDRTDNTPKTGDAGNISANLRIDGVQNAVDDAHPTELERGYYEFDLTQPETNGDLLVICPESSTGDIQVIGVPGAVWTKPTVSTVAAAVLAADPSTAVVGAAPSDLAAFIQGLWNRAFKKETVTTNLQTFYETDNTTVMETLNLSDDDTTAQKMP